MGFIGFTACISSQAELIRMPLLDLSLSYVAILKITDDMFGRSLCCSPFVDKASTHVLVFDFGHMGLHHYTARFRPISFAQA